MPSARRWTAGSVGWVLATSTLISFISYTSQIWVIYPWYGGMSWDLLKLLVPFNLCVLMIWWNYYLVVTTPPGSVPPGWRPAANATLEVKSTSHAPRYCKTCDHFKPPRAHHCRTCNDCVLKLDHHCPWVANCVGYHNHGHFIRFLLWVDIATSYHLAMLVWKVTTVARDPWAEPPLSELLFTVFNFAACVPVWLCVGMFSIYHLYLVGTNTTTIERWEKDKVATLVRRGKLQEIKYPYNVGWKANMLTVLGPKWYTWLWPQATQGDGLSFPVNPEAGGAITLPPAAAYRPIRDGIASDAQYSWPPREPQWKPAPQPSSPWVYGEGVNPSLRPSNAALRSRRTQAPWEPQVDDDGEVWNGNGEAGDDYGSSSSPEPYLSDYEDEDDRPLAYTTSRVRRGSEGWEVRPAGGQAWAAEAAWDVEKRARLQPWEEPGRYQVYDSGSD